MTSISPDTFISLVVKHKHRVQGFVAAFLPGRDHIDDVVQNTFMAAWKKTSTFTYSEETPDTEFCRWICTIARYEALNYRRKMIDSTMQFNEELIERLADMQLGEGWVETDRIEALLICIESLSKKDKGLIYERYTQGLGVLEIAKIRTVSRQSVSKWFFRIRESLARCMQCRLTAMEGTDV